jgi:hypothetical protein
MRPEAIFSLTIHEVQLIEVYLDQVDQYHRMMPLLKFQLFVDQLSKRGMVLVLIDEVIVFLLMMTM